MYWRTPVSDVEAKTEACPLCGQPPGLPCVYMPILGADADSHLSTVQVRLALVGRPTVKVHNERRRVITNARREQFHRLLAAQRYKSLIDY